MLDTNAYTAMRLGQDEVLDTIRNAVEVLMSPVVLGELAHGFTHGSRRAANERLLAEFLAESRVDVPAVTRRTSGYYGRLLTNLRRRGTPIPTNDVWIASQALEEGATLLTGDGHFRHVENLAVITFQPRTR